MGRWFDRFAGETAQAVGSAWAFSIALAFTLAWGITGPLFHFSDTWQLVINTTTTISTGLIVFLIQNTQNRDQAETKRLLREAVAEIRELVRAIPGADERVIDRARADDDHGADRDT